MNAFEVALAGFAALVATLVVAMIVSASLQADEDAGRYKIRKQTCELLGGKMFENGRCYRAEDGKIIPVVLPKLPMESK